MNQKYVVCNPATTSALYARRKVSKAPLVVIDVRRSIRLEGKTKGFTTDACNPIKDCLCCAVEPPILPGMAIRILGKDFCKIPVGKMSDDVLQKKPLVKKSAGVVQIGRANKKGNKQNEDKSTKKIKKE
jgi:hypothetical protein